MGIERRRWKRVPVNMQATISSGNISYKGQITNASLYGVGYLIASLHIMADEFSLEKTINLSLKLSSGKHLDLDCEIRWFEWEPSKGYATMGMKIINPPSAYKKFIKALTVKPEEK